MNRHQRRAANRGQLQIGVSALNTEANGVLRITTIRPDDYLAMLRDVVNGHTNHIGLLGAVADLISRVARAPSSNPMLCAACPAPLTGGYAIVVASADGSQAENGLGLGICTSCGRDLPSIEAAAVKGLSGIWPTLRPITVHPEAGHA